MTIPADLVRADQQAMLIVGTFVTAQQDPAMWERFIERMFEGWAKEAEDVTASRASTANQAIAALGRIATGRDSQPGVDASAAGNNTQSPQAPSSGAAESV